MGCSQFDVNTGEPIMLKVLCGTMTSRSCFHDHCREVYSGQVEENGEEGVNRTPAAAIIGLPRRRLT